MKIQLAPSPLSDYEAGAKRQKLSDDVKRPGTKLCIICSSLPITGGSTYDVFVADLDPSRCVVSMSKDDYIPMAPAFRLEFEGIIKGFCVLGSTLYVFESTGLGSYHDPLKSVRTLDLLSKPSLKILKKSELGSFHDLKQPKTLPLATPTPDGRKILVFSTLFCLYPLDDESETGENEFELYDPDVGKWQTLPGISYDWLGYYRTHPRHRDYVRIGGFTFIGTSTFVVQTFIGTSTFEDQTRDERLIFSIDLDSIEKGWQQRHTFFGADSIPFDGGRCIVIDDLCVTPEGALDIKKEDQFSKWFFFSSPSLHDDIKLLGPSYVALLDGVKNEKFIFGNLEIGINVETLHPHLLINTFAFDLTKYRENKEKMGSASLSRCISTRESFNFRVDKPCESFVNLGCFSF